MAKHAVLSASSSERWLNCPPSARLCEAYEDKGSDYAAEGTDAHTLCEYRLKQALGIPAEDPIENLSWYTEEMEECAAGYAAYVVELLETAKLTCSDPVVMIEQRVDFSRWVQDGFGTADCILIADGVLNIVDYKHGKGVEVSAEGNTQLSLYSLGALEIFDGIYDMDNLILTGHPFFFFHGHYLSGSLFRFLLGFVSLCFRSWICSSSVFAGSLPKEIRMFLGGTPRIISATSSVAREL